MNHEQICETIVTYRGVVAGTVKNTALRYGVNLSDADLADMVSEVTIKLIERVLVKYDPDRPGAPSPRQWVAVCAYQVTCNLLKKRRPWLPVNHTDADCGDWGEQGADAVTLPDSTDPAMLLVRREQRTRLERALAALDSADAELYRAILSGCGPEYATAHGITPIQMFRAKSRITARLAEILTD